MKNKYYAVSERTFQSWRINAESERNVHLCTDNDKLVGCGAEGLLILFAQLDISPLAIPLKWL